VKKYYHKQLTKLINEINSEIETKEGASEDKLNSHYIKVLGPFLSLVFCLNEFNYFVNEQSMNIGMEMKKQLSLQISSLLFGACFFEDKKEHWVVENRKIYSLIVMLKAILSRDKEVEKMVGYLPKVVQAMKDYVI